MIARASEPETSGVKQEIADVANHLKQPTSRDRLGKTQAPEDPFQSRVMRDPDVDEEPIDDNQSVTTRTDDDIVREAFNIALQASDDEDEDEDDEQIVYQPGCVPPCLS